MSQMLNWACVSGTPADEHYAFLLTLNTNEEKEREEETEKTELPLTINDDFLFSCSSLVYFYTTVSWSLPWL